MKNTIVILDDNQKDADRTKFIVYKRNLITEIFFIEEIT